MQSLLNYDVLVQAIADAIVLNEKRKEMTIPKVHHDDVLFTREEAAEFLRISLPTLAKYTQRGVVKGRCIGNRILYRKSELLIAGRNQVSLKNKTGM